jgi:glucose/arabinose dehydrogenase
VAPEFPASWPAAVRKQLERDFPVAATAAPKAPASAEAAHYRLVTVPVPKDVVLEVGGLAFRPDGKLLACTRRGEVWLISNPGADDPNDVKFKLFATGLHEALGLCVVGKDVYVTQRPELTRLVDTDGDDVADDYVPVCDKWGVSGDYHEFAYGPARDKQGNFYVTLNVGFGGGHQSKAPWRGWLVKVSPKGELTPYAVGLRSPNGVNFSPDGDLFYCDNQGEWVATNKMHHVREGDYYGHPAGLRWVTQSPLAGKVPDKHLSGMLYDGQKGQTGVSGMPPHVPPCIWFPYGRMGQSASEPVWDTTGGKFGPFAGQCFVGDQNKSIVMRVCLEKVNGRYQGACFPFRAGFESGVNRLAFAPDGSLFAGMTNRGWGSVGGKSFGLQRLAYTGVLPFEVHAMKLTKDGFDLTFTKPLDGASAEKVAAYSLQSFTYNYWGTYGSPEVDQRAEKVQAVSVSADRKAVSLKVDGFRPGRVYELHLNGVKSADGDPVLHPEAYYTLNEVPKE